MRDVVDAYQILLSNQGVKGAARDGTVSANVEKFTIRELMNDEDGSAFIVHAGTDDYASQPSGAAGDRIACGVFGE